MDNSQYGTPSAEWRAYDAAHPELHINDEGKNDIPHTFASPIELRDAANAAREAASRKGLAALGLDKTVAITEYTVPTRDGSSIPLRAYLPRGAADPDPQNGPGRPAYLFFHGGGMLFGTRSSDDFSCALWASKLGGRAVVLSACYRHTPDFVFPTQIDDAWDAFEWVVSSSGAADLGIDASRVVVGGISAGGMLAASVALHELAAARADGGRPLRLRGQLLAIPWVIHADAYPYHLFAARDKSSPVQCADAPILPLQRYRLFGDLFQVKDPRDPRMNAALAPDEALRGLPRTAFIACGWDMLRDDAFIFAERLEKLGVPTKKHVFDGMPHGFRKYADLPSSKRWDDLTVESLLWLFDEEAPASEKGKWQVEVSET